MKKRINWKVLIISLVIIYAVAFIGSLFTSPNTNTEWYNSIKPSITPPNYVFPIVWNILFFLIAISLYISWTNSNKNQKEKIALVFGINFVLNILWSVLYFGMQNPLLAFYEIIFLEISIFSMIYTTYKINKASSYLLIPYFIWVGFAMILNYLSTF
jgi:translocator protein